MIREVARCPYCDGGGIAVDDDPLTLLFNPDRPGGEPCRHLAFASVGLEALSPVLYGLPMDGHSAGWLWVRGEGLRRLTRGHIDPLADYVDMLACDLIPGPEDLPAVEYLVAGATAGDREEARPGTGEFPFAARGAGPQFLGILDGWGLYARDPEALVDAVRRLAGRRDGPNSPG
jgi:hypothetical protein